MLENSKFIVNDDIVVEDRNSWNNMGFNDKSKRLPDKGGIPRFKRIFALDKPVKSATLTATALGIFDIFINGARVGQRQGEKTVFDELKPGWTDYNHRVFAFTYDVTDLLHDGENTCLAEVSCGWYSCRISFGIYGFRKPAFCCDLTIEYADGTSGHIVTDEKWQTALGGPVRTADIWDGEYYDARLDREEGIFGAASVTDYDGIITHALPPYIRVRESLTLAPVSARVFDGTRDNGTDFGEINIISEKEGDDCEHTVLNPSRKLILDFAQNHVGRPRIEIRAKAGTTLTFYFGELLNDSGDAGRGNDGAKGSVYVKNYRSALSRFVYVAKGDGCEAYAPRHTFFGYRYLEIETSDECEIISVRAEVVGSENRETARFECSDDEVNKLWENIVWGQRSNYLSIPTDCPQRDERLGWTGDTQIFCGAGSYIADIYDFMRKWLQDARDCQNDDGSYCDVIPKVFKKESFQGNAAWGDAGIIVPYEMYKKYGKTEILAEHFDSMEKYMDYLSRFRLEGANTAYGDWLAYDETDKRYIAVCYLACDARIMSECARILGKKDRCAHYERLFYDVKEHFAERYIKDGDITEKTQTGYLLALHFSLLPDDYVLSARASLRKLIEDNDYTLTTGFVGTGILCQTLAENDMNDLCYSLLLQTRDPSWLYSIRQGATTVWERWNSYTKEKGFGDVGMNSFNHYAYGAVAEWMMSTMAGIIPKKPGFEEVLINPVIDMRKLLPEGQKRITYVKAELDTDFGVIRSEWHSTDRGCIYKVHTPVRGFLVTELFGGSYTVNGSEFPNSDEYTRIPIRAGEDYTVEVTYR